MKFDELDTKMRHFETANDTVVLPGIYMVARIDGRSFTKLTKDVHKFEAPYDERFRDYMVETVKHLMECGFRTVYGYTQSDEISIVFHQQEATFSRKVRKYNSVLAGEASAKFSLLLGDLAAFDCRISQLPTEANLVDYLRWRSEDAHRNALNAHTYWALRREGLSQNAATEELVGLSTAQKNELLYARANINFNDIPTWQKRGVGVYWKEVEKEGFNPKTGETTATTRRQLFVDYDLPMKDDYDAFARELLLANGE